MRASILVMALVAIVTAAATSFAQMPRSLPAVDPAQGLPPGHPPVNSAGAPGGGLAQRGGFMPPGDISRPDPSLPAGTVQVRIVNADGAPTANKEVTVIQALQTPTETSEERFKARTDETGTARISGLQTGTDYQFVAFTDEGPASYATKPFRLNARAGHDILLHVYPATARMPQTVVAAGRLSIEPGEDRFRISVRYEFLNMQPISWVPSDVLIALPEGAESVSTQSSEGSLRFEKRDGAVQLAGTAAPGSHVAFYSFSLANPNASTFEFDLPVAPHLVAMIIEAATIQGMSLTATDYPPAEPSKFGDIDTLTTRLVRIPDPADLEMGEIAWIPNVEVAVSGLPTQGGWRIYVAIIAALIGLGGAALAFEKPAQRDSKQETDVEQARRVLLAELVEVERAQRDGRIGPKTYRKAKAMLLDAVARL